MVVVVVGLDFLVGEVLWFVESLVVEEIRCVLERILCRQREAKSLRW